MDRLPFYGAATGCVDNERLARVLPRVRRRVFTYGESAEADFRLVMLGASDAVSCDVWGGISRGDAGAVSAACAGAAQCAECDGGGGGGGAAGAGLGGDCSRAGWFSGVDRRFQTKGTVGGVTVVDDYGHHPTEIVATLKAARECGYGAVHVVFQPHRYTRTRDLMAEFAGAFGDADSVEVLDIYAASEEPILGVTGERLA